MPWSRTLIALALMILVAACGSPPATPADAGDGDGTESEQSEPAEPTPAEGDGGGDAGNGGDGSGSGSLDVDRTFEILIPPNASELTKTTAEGIIFAAFDSSDSLDTLRSFYEEAIAEAGLVIVSTTEAQDGVAWAVTASDDTNFGGAISLFPAQDGSGTQVSITIGEGA